MIPYEMGSPKKAKMKSDHFLSDFCGLFSYLVDFFNQGIMDDIRIETFIAG